jgi:putative nucleotidyltransferase with HDIG domain
VPVRDRDIVAHAFSSAEWMSSADALFKATGVTVNVLDAETGEPLGPTARCACCHLATDSAQDAVLDCFDEPVSAVGGMTRILCRAGLAALAAPVVLGDTAVAFVVVAGFVTSTRDRRRVYESLIGRDVRESAARLAVKSLSVVPRGEAEGYLQMSLACANTIVRATAERMRAAERVEELRLFVSAGQQVVATERLDASMLGLIAEEAAALVGGEAAAVLRPIAGALEVIARTEQWRGAVGALVPREGTASGRAATTGRTVFSAGRNGAAGALALPLTVGQRVLGVLEVRVPAAATPVSPERVARLDRFARFIAIALVREDERHEVERAMIGYAQLNSLAAALGGQTDIGGVVRLVANVLAKSYDFDIGGLVLSSYGRDHAEVSVAQGVGRTEIDEVLAEVAARDVVDRPFDTLAIAEQPDRAFASSTRPGGEDWAILTADLGYGDLTLGTLFVARADGGHYAEQDHALLEGIAAHTGEAVGRAALFTRIRDDYAKTIAALSATLDATERVPGGHASRVMDYAMLIGEELGLPFEEVEQLRFAGLLHDVGKTGVPAEILLKPSKLSAEELEHVRAHAELGATIVDQIEFLKSLTPVILHHHERWDGQGYPAGLAGEEIPLLARVLAVADSFDAMRSDRPHRKKLPLGTAKAELKAGAGSQFDPQIVTALLDGLGKQAAAGKTGLLANQARQAAETDTRGTVRPC